MATGFMTRHSSALRAAGLLLALAALPAVAQEVTLVGIFGDKAAILAIGGGEPKTVRVGQKLGDLTLVSVDGERATIEIDGKRRQLTRGQTYSSRVSSERQSVTLAADASGHFIAEGTVNGGSMRFVVDTGATSIALPAADAERLGIDYRKGRRVSVQTANGDAIAYVVRLGSVRVGGIEIPNIDALVVERGLSIALLGMTFLNRVEMQRSGDRMTLTRRF
jgi:aspartyl protease family protein